MGRIKTWFFLLLVGGIIYCAARLLPPYFENYQFQDDLASVAKYDAPNAKSQDDTLALVKKKAAAYDIALTDDQIDISSDAGKVIINVKYTVSVNLLPNKTVVIKFNDSSLKGSPVTGK